MRKYILLIVFIQTPIIVFCTNISEGLKEDTKIECVSNDILLPDSIVTNSSLCGHWILAKRKSTGTNYQNYSGGAYKELILKCGGQYKRISSGYNTSGNWVLSNDTLGFIQAIANGVASVLNGVNRSWIIVEVDSSKLILKTLGRHGFEYYFYVPKK